MKAYDAATDLTSRPHNTLWIWSLWLFLSASLPLSTVAQSPSCAPLADTLVLVGDDCATGLAVCLPFSLNSNGQYDIWVDGVPYQGTRTGCDFDTLNVYFLGLVINGGIGPYELRWTVNGVLFTAVVGSFQAVADSMNAFDPLGGWSYDPMVMTIAGGASGQQYSPIRLEFLPINSPATIGANQIVTANGTQIRIPASASQLIVRDTALTCSDTATILAFCTTTDTLDIGLTMGDSVRICLDTSELAGTITSATIACPAAAQVIAIGSFSSDYCLSANALFTGQTDFCVVLCDAMGLCDTTHVRMTVTPRPDTFRFSVPIGDTLRFCVPTDELPDVPQSLTDLGCSALQWGTAVLTDSCVTYTAGMVAGQSDTLCLVLTDAQGWQDTTILTFTLHDSLNVAPPVAIHDIHAAFAGRLVTGNVLTNDLSPDGDSLVATQLLDLPSSGSLVLRPDGSYTFAAGSSATAVRYVVCDVQTPSWCDTATLYLEVLTPLASRPIALGDHGRLASGSTTQIRLTANDLLLTDTAQASLLSVAIITPPTRGTATLNAATLTYTVPASASGLDSLWYSLCLGSQCDTGLVTLSIQAATPPVTAVDDAWATFVERPIAGNVLLNDWSSAGGSLSANVGTLPASGSLTFLPDGSFNYTPATAFVGTVQFTYQVCDAATPQSCDSATAYLVVSDRIVTVTDTVYATLEVGTDSTFCVRPLLGDTFTLVDLGCAPLQGSWTALNDTCFTYQAGTTPQVTDTLCLVLSDAFGNLDTTVYLVTTQVTPFSLPTDTVVVVNLVGSTDTLCVSSSGLVGSLLNSTISHCGSTLQGNFTILSDTCFAYTSSVVGNDTICVVVNDEFGITDTTVFVLQTIDLHPDTLYLTLNASTDTVICLDPVLDFVTPILTVQDLGCSPLDQTLAAILGTSGCIRLVTNLTAGSDTLCVVACSALGYCDTTYIIIQVAASPDTLFQTLATGDSLVHCFPNNELTGVITSTSVVQAPALASSYTATYSPTTGDICLTYVATQQAGSDTAVIVLCNAAGICDTTTVIYTVEPSCDNFDPMEATVYQYTPDCAAPSVYCLDDLSGSSTAYTFLVDGAPVSSVPCGNGSLGVDILPGWHTVIVNDTVNQCADTALVALLCAASDTSLITVSVQDSLFLCHPQQNLALLPSGLNVLDTAYLGCMPPNGWAGTVTTAQPWGCWSYVAPALPATDTVCWTVCDALGHCETQVYVLTSIATPDTIVLTLSEGRDSVFCVSTEGLTGGQVFDIYVGCDTLDNAALDVMPPDTCVSVTALSPGRDSTCLVVCDSLGNCDTTFLVVIVTEEVDSAAFAARPDQIEVCTTVVFNVLANDVGLGTPDTLFLLTIPARGIARIWSDTVLYYEVVDEAARPFVDQFAYVVCVNNQCDTATVTINAVCDRPVVVYNGLSPNGDFFNDVWVIDELPNYPNRVQVFNRWGNRVFIKENYQNDWGGTWRSDDLPDGTYFYLVEYEKNGEWIRLSGYLQLHR